MSFTHISQTGAVVNFTTKNTTVLPQSYKNVTVEGVVSFAVASKLEDVVSKYMRILPHIPGMNADYTTAKYLIINHQNGESEVLCLDWIEETTIELVSTTDIIIRIPNISSTAIYDLQRILALNGYSDFTIGVER